MRSRISDQTTRLGSVGFATVLLTTITAANALAVNPGAVEVGRQLFERQWSPSNPLLGSDGLGPLFNANSCVGCHHQGGVGGGGDARFNAKTIGIEQMQISGQNSRDRVTNDVIVRIVRQFNPGFVGPTGGVTNNFPLAHHGGTPAFVKARTEFIEGLPAIFSDEGGPADAAEVRLANATPILYSDASTNYQLSVRARMFQRNTTSLFGSGLIDQVKDRDLDALVRAQQNHPEISGRPATLSDGRYGKFGWRGNVVSLLEFCDQACANEVGLETRRKPQSIDPTNPGYRNPTADIADNQIRAMATFVSMLPAPQREFPSDSLLRRHVDRGEQLFTAVGCAVCHTPSVGPVQGLYSDLLLHDMGYELMDLNHAEPYMKRVTPVVRVVQGVSNVRTVRQTNTVGYYGGTSSMTINTPGPGSDTASRSGSAIDRVFAPNRHYRFVAPQRPTLKLELIPLTSESWTEDNTSTETSDVNVRFASGRRQTGTTTTTTTVTNEMTQEQYLRVHYEPTNFNQEWRTPPLWGVRDSAPYMHDGRAASVLEAVAMHDGESAGTRDRFLALTLDDREAVLAFLNTFVAPSNVPQPSL